MAAGQPLPTSMCKTGASKSGYFSLIASLFSFLFSLFSFLFSLSLVFLVSSTASFSSFLPSSRVIGVILFLSVIADYRGSFKA